MAQQPAAARARQPLADYELLGTIGEGRHAKVKLGRHLLTGIEVAVKVIPRRGFGRRERPVLQEAESMLGLRHPHIVQLFQLIETEQSLFLVMEHLSSGDLCDHMETHGRMAEGAARHVFRQLVSAVQYCHAKGVIHRDLKPQNVLLDLTLTAKLTDFSLSSPFGAGKLGTLCGTPSYMAPEVFGGEEYDGPPVDIWSLGVVLYQMVTGTTPFKGNTLKQLMKKICRGVYVVPKHVSGQLQHLLRALIAVEPKDRRPLAQVMTDGWLNLGHTEELRPFAEPEGEDLDPGVEQEMVAMGFAPEDIQRSLAQKAYDHTMATYLILATERARIPYRTILVRPRGAADPHGPGASADLGPGQEAEDSVGPSGSAGSGKATARRSPKSKKASVQRRAKHAKVSPRHSPKLPSDIERPSRKFRASTARGGPKRRIAALPPDCGLYLDSDSDPDARPTGPPPVLDARPTGPPPVLDARPTGPPPVLDATPTGPPPVLDARPTGPPPVLDATPTGPPPVLDARPTGPPPVLDATPTGPPPVLDATPTGPPPVLDAGPTGPPPVLDATPTGPPPVLDATPTGPPPVLDAGPTGPPPVLDAGPTGPPPVLDATPTGPPPVLDAGPTGPSPVLDAGPTGPPPQPKELRTTPPTENREQKNGTARPAPQIGPGDSPSTHNVRSSSCERAEGESQGRRGLARRCLNLLRKLCCLPPKKGYVKSHQIQPL